MPRAHDTVATPITTVTAANTATTTANATNADDAGAADDVTVRAGVTGAPRFNKLVPYEMPAQLVPALR